LSRSFFTTKSLQGHSVPYLATMLVFLIKISHYTNMISRSIEDTQKAAQDFLKNLDQVTVVRLVGDLGAGKTTFTQALAQELGIQQTVVSPTFVIQKRYPIADHPYFKTLIHVDAYRLEKPNEILKLNWEQDIVNPENLILVEWPSNIETFPPQTKTITFNYIDEKTREIQY
jgi:tRNA threonylcarbamoyladenosine biosynthesis protein TsaE